MSFDDSILMARPPYIRFERRPIERRKLAEEGGGVYFVDQDFALVTAHGAKDTTEKLVEEWFPRLAEDARQGRFNPQWLDVYKSAYAAWKNDQELPINGTPVKTWPGASPAEIKNLLNLRVTTLEDLAAANEELIGRLGMGGRSLKKRAVDWLLGMKGQAPLVAQLDAQRQIIAGLEARLKDMSEQVSFLGRQLEHKQSVISTAVSAGLPPVEDRLYEAQLQIEQAAEELNLDRTIENEIG